MSGEGKYFYYGAASAGILSGLTLRSRFVVPRWYEKFKYPQWVWVNLFAAYRMPGLPINLVWLNTTIDVVKSTILKEGDWVTGLYAMKELVYDPEVGWIHGDGIAEKRLGAMGRYHTTLFAMPNNIVVANAHHDTAAHIPYYRTEEAKKKVVSFFKKHPEWEIKEDNYYLSNAAGSANGWCTEIIFRGK